MAICRHNTHLSSTWTTAAWAIPAGVLATGAAALAYGAGVETRTFRLREATVPVLPAGHRDLQVLHISDLHLLPRQGRKRAWVRELATLRPDLVINTGDNLAAMDAVPAVVDTYEPLFTFPGVFVWGSNDFFAPVPKNPARYLLPRRQHRRGRRLPWRDLREAMIAGGWMDATHQRHTLTLADTHMELRGVNDAHLNYDRYDRVAGAPGPTAQLAIGVTHAPYRRVLDAMTDDGLGLIIAGHTHGGQLRVPGYGALVSNCDLPVRQARGLSRWGSGADPAWLHVSAGLGCSPWSPVRIACPPEATLLTLTARTQ